MNDEQLASAVLAELIKQAIDMQSTLERVGIEGMSPRVQDAAWKERVEEPALTAANEKEPDMLQTLLSHPPLREALSPDAWRYVSENFLPGARAQGGHELTETQRKSWGGGKPEHSAHNVAILYDQVRLILQLKFPDLATNEKAISIASHLSDFDKVKLGNHLRKHPRP